MRAEKTKFRHAVFFIGALFAWLLAYGLRFGPYRERPAPLTVEAETAVVPAPVVTRSAGRLPTSKPPSPSNPPALDEPRAAIVGTELYEPVYKDRDPEEWQGLRVDISAPSDCERDDGCNLGLACIHGKCLPCEQDAQCPSGEACVLDHCVPKRNAACASRRDCKADELCFLTGYRGTSARMNERMLAYCAATSGDNPYAPAETPDDGQEQEDHGPTEIPRAPGVIGDMEDELLRHARAQLGQR